MTSTLHVIVRAALDELDSTPGRDHWRVMDSDKLTESILAHMLAFGLARAEEEDRDTGQHFDGHGHLEVDCPDRWVA